MTHGTRSSRDDDDDDDDDDNVDDERGNSAGVDGRVAMGVAAGVLNCDRLCARCARTRWPAASAERSESSPAMTAAATMRASC